MVKQGKQDNQEDKAVPKSITITARQQRFIEDKSINLSKFIQKKLDEEIEKAGWRGE